MEKLLPEHLKDFWQSVVRHEHTTEDYTREYDRALAEYRQTWDTRADPACDTRICRRVFWPSSASYTQCADVAEVRRRCEQAVANVQA